MKSFYSSSALKYNPSTANQVFLNVKFALIKEMTKKEVMLLYLCLLKLQLRGRQPRSRCTQSHESLEFGLS